MAQPEHHTLYVDNAEALDFAVKRMESAPEIYLDLEADSLHHYHAKICLLQVHVGNEVFLVDPLAGFALTPLLDLLARKRLVFHGGDYDLRMLYQAHGFRPLAVFDTMIAAQLMGFTAFGLGSLVQERYGQTLNKDHQKADWSRRPLPEELRAYASQDTIFLPDLCNWLTEGLEKLGRLQWHAQACQALIKATAKIKEVDEDDDPWRVHGSAKLYPRQLAALKAIWILREQEADSRDLPSFKICPTELLIRLALAIPPEGRPELWPNLPSRWSDDFRQRLVDALEAVLIQAPAAWPARKSGPKRVLKHPDPDLLQKLRDIRDEKAKELALDPSLIATRATMTAAALTGCVKADTVRASVNWMPWQEELLLPLWLKVGGSDHTT
jgi:ribonuclease D